MSAKADRDFILEAVDEGFCESLKTMVTVLVSSAAGSGGNPTEALKHFEAGLRLIRTARAGAAAAVDRVFPA